MGRYTVHDVIAAEFTLEPILCLHCGSATVVYHQYVGDGYRETCGEWQLEEEEWEARHGF